MSINVVIKGLCVCPGIVQGRARVVRSPEELEAVEYGEIVILPESHPMYALAVMKASGLICENGGRLSHICIVAMEMGIPCITQAHNATEKIKSGENIFMDANEGEISVNG